MVTTEIISAQLAKTLLATNFPTLGEKYEGKVRDCYMAGGKRTIVVTDRISAFDVVLGTIPFKGQVLNEIASYWFNLTKNLVANHVESVPDPNVMVATECRPLPVEFVMRAYLTGSTKTSIWYHYEQGARTFCGYPLAEGMKKNQPLDRPLLTPSTKAEKGEHDESVSADDLLRRGVINEQDFDRAAAMCAKLFKFGQEEAARRGLILVDTKYEIGRRPDDSLCFIDEVHTPDSSRYWYADDYKKRFDGGEAPRGLDKDYVRNAFSDKGYRGDGPPPPLTDEIRIEAARRYMALYELVTGRAFVPNTEEPVARIKKNLRIK